MSFIALILFSAYAVVGVLGVGSDTAYADALKHGDMLKHSHQFVVVDSDNDGQGNGNGGGGIARALAGSQDICSLTPTQASELDAFFNVHTRNINVGSTNVEVATVQGRHLTRQQLLDFLRATNQTLDCEVVGVHHIFIFPIIPQIS
jgi:hypothetical protein